MTSKALSSTATTSSSSPSPSSSALSQLISQWAQQPHTSRPSYRILFQYTTDLSTRIQAVQTVDNPLIYQRAGIRTPLETAFRDLLGGPAWLSRIVELGCHHSCRVVFVKTLTRSLSSLTSPLSLQFQKNQITTIHAAATTTTGKDSNDSNNNCTDPWGWDTEPKESDDSGKKEEVLSLFNLVALANAIRTQVKTTDSTKNNDSTSNGPSSTDNNSGDEEHPPILLVWESLTPLILVHGLERTLQFLSMVDTFSSTHFLQIWCTRMETLTSKQHAKLEDAAQALLYLKGGNMTLLRQGVRESGNMVREILPFELLPTTIVDHHQNQNNNNNSKATVSYIVKEGTGRRTNSNQEPNLVVSKDSSINTVAPTGASRRGAGPKDSLSGRPKIKLELENDDDGPKKSVSAASSSSTRPRIYLQDDDPEFDDMDEEDPDDDLEL